MANRSFQPSGAPAETSDIASDIALEEAASASRRPIKAEKTDAGRFIGGRAPDVLGPGTLRPFTKVELDAVALLQILEPFAVHGAPVKEVAPSPPRP